MDLLAEYAWISEYFLTDYHDAEFPLPDVFRPLVGEGDPERFLFDLTPPLLFATCRDGLFQRSPAVIDSAPATGHLHFLCI